VKPSSTLGQSRHFDRLPTTSGLPRSTDFIGPARLVRSCHDRKWLRPIAPRPDEDYSLKSSGNIVMKMVTLPLPARYMVRVNACARRSTRRGGSSRRLLGRRWRRSRGRSRSRRGRRGSRSRAWFTATVHHAHSSRAALADRGPHRGVPYTDAFDQLTPQPTSLANRNDRIVRLLKRDVGHTLH